MRRLALILCLAAPAAARVVPTYDADIEDLVVGRRTAPSSPRTVGTWYTRPGQVAPGPEAKLWLVESEGQSIIDGTIRARFAKPDTLDTTLLVRASRTTDGQRLASAYGVAIYRRTVALIHVRNGVVILAKKGRLKRHRSDLLEVVIQLMGRHVVVNFYEGKGDRRVGSLSSSDVPRQPGAIGLMAGQRWTSDSPLVHLSTRPLCQDLPKDEARGPAHLVRIADVGGVVASTWGDPVERFAGSPPTVVLRTGPVGVERLFCDGPELLDVTNDLPWKFVDPAYRTYRRRGPIRTARGFDLTRSYKNVEMVNALLEGWHARYPDKTVLRQIGKSRKGRAILALGIGAGITPEDRRPSVLLNATHHGNEPISTEFVLDAIQRLVEPSRPRAPYRQILEKMVVWCVPMMNPDGNWGFFETSKRLGRKNGRDMDGDGRWTERDGVDLNRNYPFRWGSLGEKGSQSDSLSRYYRGDAAASEPETRAMVAFANRERFVASISFHTGTVAVLAPYTIDEVASPEPNEAWTVAEEIIEGMPRHPQGKRRWAVVRQLYAVDGTDQDWHRHANGTLALLVEGAKFTPREMDDRGPIVQAVRPIWTRLLQRYLDGPTVSGRVVDRDGRPVHAEVRIKEIRTREGERWTTRCRDGRFDRYLPKEGTYTVQVHARGYAPIELAVYAGEREKNAWVDVRLPGPGVPSADCPIR